MLRMLRRILVIRSLRLNHLVLLAEADVAVCVQFCHVLVEHVNWNRAFVVAQPVGSDVPVQGSGRY